MAKRAEHRSATVRFATIARTVAGTVAVLFLVPALAINVNWVDGVASPWNWAAVGSVVGSAVFVEAARHSRSWGWAPLYVLLAFALFLANTQTAFENASHKSDRRSDHRKSLTVAAETARSQRSQWSHGRTAAATVAGEAAPTTIQSEIDAKVSAEAGRWRASHECDPLEIKSQGTRDFCSEVSTLKAKKAAAERRDELDGKIAKLDEKTETKEEAPTSLDPFADNVAAFVLMFGVRLSDDTKRAIGAQKDFTRSVTLELIATFGPSAWLLMVQGMFAVVARVPAQVPAPERKPEARKGRWFGRKEQEVVAAVPAPVVAPEPPVVALDDPFHKFVAECIEEAAGINLPAGDAFKAWQAWCSKNGVDPGHQKPFGLKMIAKFARDNNNNRPRYLNIRLKQARPSLRVVG